MMMNIEDLIKKYESLEGVWSANGAEIARHCFLRDLKQLNAIDTKKVTVPQYVADWIEEAKKEGYSIFGAINKAPKGEVEGWIELQNVEIFAEAWVNGYEVEKEKRYTVKMRATKQPLFYNNMYEKIFFSLGELATRFTRKELEGAGLGWVFDCPGVEVEEVEG
jgi:hypothetical protein